MSNQQILTKDVVPQIISDINNPENALDNPRDKLVLRLNEQFPGDVGIIATLLLNYITLKKGEVFSMDPDEPHAYIKGNCMEAMALSDNVVRLGLTPKFKDEKVLIEMLTYNLDKGPSYVKPKSVLEDLYSFDSQNKNSSFEVFDSFSSGYHEFEMTKISEGDLGIPDKQRK